MLGLSWLLNIAYLLLLLAVSPILVYKSLTQGKYRVGWSQKLLGKLPMRQSARRCVWFHAVSVGEVLQLQSVLSDPSQLSDDCQIVISTTTSTGHAVARKCFPEHMVCYFPLDFSWAVRRAFRRIRPDLIVLVELELWPNFVLHADRLGIPLVLINGRVSEHSFLGYRKIGFLIRRLLGRFQTLAAQNVTYADRLIALGAPSDRVVVTGTIKFDGIQTDRCNAKTQELHDSFAIAGDAVVFVAGSTQAPEEQFALTTWETLRHDFPKLRLILVPRHKERFEEVARLVTQNGHRLIRRTGTSSTAERTSKIPAAADASETSASPVLLLDTLGELAACWGLADIAFVGGSLTRRGGQNMIEPAGYGAAVLFGPNTWNFRDVVDALLEKDAARVVRDPEDLTETVRFLLATPEAAGKMGAAAQQFVVSQRGATERTIVLLRAALEDQHL